MSAIKNTTRETAYRIAIKNINNKLDNKYFLHITLAPPPGTVIESLDEESIYVIDKDGKDVYAKLLGYHDMKFERIPSYAILISEGLDVFDYWKKFLDQSPLYNMETKMAIYSFELLD